jgi:transcriptional adapter 2-alpha
MSSDLHRARGGDEDDNDFVDEKATLEDDEKHQQQQQMAIDETFEKPPPSTPAASTTSAAAASSTPSAAAGIGGGDADDADAGVKYHCDYCRKDISGGIRIKCAECTDFDLCVECFSVGVEVTPHQNGHAYQVMDRVNFPLFDEEWEAEEELLLLEAIAKYGLGNWEDVADHVGTKSLVECRQHYFDSYIDVPTGPLPDTGAVLTTSATLAGRKREADERANSHYKKKRNKKVVRAANNVQESSKTLPGQRPPSPQQIGVVGGSASSAAAGNSTYASAPVSLELAGFMPLRNEFETEYFNDAEEIISPLTFDDDDTADEVEAKYRLLDLYNRKLAERYARRKFVIERQLMYVKKLQMREKDLARDERETYGRLRVFMQVLSRTDFDTFVDGILAERRIRRRIEQMQRWRQAGCRTVNAGERFADDVKRRTNDGGGVRKRAESDQAATQMIAADRRRKLEALAKWYYKVPKARKNAPLLVHELPGAPLLTMREAELCADMRIYPKQYLLIKDTLLRLNQLHGPLARQHMKQHVSLDASRATQVYQFLETAGWLHSPDQLLQLKQEALQQIAAAAAQAKAAADAAAAATAAAAAAAATKPEATAAATTTTVKSEPAAEQSTSTAAVKVEKVEKDESQAK